MVELLRAELRASIFLKRAMDLLKAFFAIAAFLLPVAVSAVDLRVQPKNDGGVTFEDAKAGDTIVIPDGTWTNAELKFRLYGTESKPIVIRAETPGKVVFSGRSVFRVGGQHVVIEGLDFLNCDGQSDVFTLRADSKLEAGFCRVTNCVFQQTVPNATTKESRWFSVYGSSNRIDHCAFLGKQNKGTTFVVWVGDKPSEHRIDFNYFGPRQKLGKNGGETIRIGDSNTSLFSARCVVENNLFRRCDGEAEIVSNKSCDNIYRLNRFEECSGALTLRHGNRCRVDSNVFLGGGKAGTGGVRIIGTDHIVVNNYFEGLRGDTERAAISFMNGVPNSPANEYVQVERAVVAHNTIIDCKETLHIGVGASEKVSLPPSKCVVVNNLLVSGKWDAVHFGSVPQDFIWDSNLLDSDERNLLPAWLAPADIRRCSIALATANDGFSCPKTDSIASKICGRQLSEAGSDRNGNQRDDHPDAGCEEINGKNKVAVDYSVTGPYWFSKQ